MMNDWMKIRISILDAFANVPKPDFKTLPIIGCCERHKQDLSRIVTTLGRNLKMRVKRVDSIQPILPQFILSLFIISHPVC
jgi:hypothetical protein